MSSHTYIRKGILHRSFSLHARSATLRSEYLTQALDRTRTAPHMKVKPLKTISGRRRRQNNNSNSWSKPE